MTLQIARSVRNGPPYKHVRSGETIGEARADFAP